MDFTYFAYGFNIRSPIPLPELLPAGGGDPGASISVGEVSYAPARPAPMSCFPVDYETIFFSPEGVGKFLVRGGREITVEPHPGVEERVLRLFLLGPALGILLHQRGSLVLHASSVSVRGTAVAFLGNKGWGKSTMAAALHARGHTLVADDIVSIRHEGDSQPTVSPGFPQLKLWPDAAAQLGERVESLPLLHPLFDKRARRVADGFSPLPLPLSRIFVLAEGEETSVEPLGPQDALLELVRHTYGAQRLIPKGDASHFRACARLVSKVPVSRLKRPRSLPRVAEVARLVEEEVSREFP